MCHCAIVVLNRLKNRWSPQWSCRRDERKRKKGISFYCVCVVKCVCCATLWLDDFVIVCHIFSIVLVVCRHTSVPSEMCKTQCVRHTKILVSFATSFFVQMKKRTKYILYISFFVAISHAPSSASSSYLFFIFIVSSAHFSFSLDTFAVCVCVCLCVVSMARHANRRVNNFSGF